MLNYQNIFAKKNQNTNEKKKKVCAYRASVDPMGAKMYMSCNKNSVLRETFSHVRAFNGPF